MSLEAGEYGDLGITNNESDVLRCLVLSKYHFRALTGQTNLSSLTDDAEVMSGRKTGLGVNDMDWFFAKKDGSGSIYTPDGEKRMKPRLIDNA